MANQQIKMILQFQGDDVKRSFDEESLLKTDLGPALNKLKSKQRSLVRAFPHLEMIYKHIFDNFDDLFYKLQPVPWYLDLIAKKLREAFNRRSAEYTVKIKGCKDHQFIDIYEVLDKNKRRLLLRPFFHKSIPPTEVKNNKEKIRGVADTLLFLSPLLLDNVDKKAEVTDLFAWFEIELKAQELNKVGDVYELLIEAKHRWTPSTTDESKQCITYFSVTDQEERKILISSPNVRVAIQQLSEVWHNPIAKSVLLSAWTGSGKEELKELLIYGLGITEKHLLISRSAPEIISMPQSLDSYFNNNIIGELIKSGAINKRTGEIDNKPIVLFFDEIHHDGVEKLRAALLRFMESTRIVIDKKEIYRKGIVIDRDEINYKGALFLFAASKSPGELRSFPPPDFWTRIEYFVKMEHPLDLKDKVDRHDTLKQYFCLFWRKAAEDRGKREPSKIVSFLQQPQNIECLADAFAGALDSPLIPLISIRAIRSIVNRLLSRAIYHTKTTEIRKASIVEEIKRHMDGWIVEIRKEIVPEIDPHGVF